MMYGNPFIHYTDQEFIYGKSTANRKHGMSIALDGEGQGSSDEGTKSDDFREIPLACLNMNLKASIEGFCTPSLLHVFLIK